MKKNQLQYLRNRSSATLECVFFGPKKPLKCLCRQEECRKEVSLRLCLSRNMEFPALVLRNFGPFIPGITSTGGDVAAGDEDGVRSNRAGCGQLLCTKKCLAAADIYWPQVRTVKPPVTYLQFQSLPRSQVQGCMNREPDFFLKLDVTSGSITNTT